MENSSQAMVKAKLSHMVMCNGSMRMPRPRSGTCSLPITTIRLHIRKKNMLNKLTTNMVACEAQIFGRAFHHGQDMSCFKEHPLFLLYVYCVVSPVFARASARVALATFAAVALPVCSTLAHSFGCASRRACSLRNIENVWSSVSVSTAFTSE